jgi:hypothetical protein
MKILRRAFILLLVVAAGCFILGFALFRMPVGKRVSIESEVKFKSFDLPIGTLRESYWEYPLGNEHLYLADGSLFYVSKEDQERVWAEAPSKLRERRRTLKVVVSACPVLVGGFGKARIDQLVEMPGQPLMQK